MTTFQKELKQLLFSYFVHAEHNAPNDATEESAQAIIELVDREIVGSYRDLEEFSIKDNRLCVLFENDLKAEQKAKLGLDK